MSFSIKGAIAKLGNSDHPLPSSSLADLSSLSSQELKALEQAWSTIEPKRKRQIVYRLVELAEDNFELNFDNIFKNRLQDQDSEVRSKAIEGLWESEDASLIDSLINLLEQDTSEKVRTAAAIALGKFAMLAEHNKLRSCHTSKVCQALLSVISDKSKPIELRRRALEAAAPLSLPQVERVIVEAYQSRNSKLRTSAIYSMGKNYNCSWLPILLKELCSADAEMRYEAVGACGELGEEKAVSYLVELVRVPDVDIQLAAIQALGKIGGTEAKECLERCLGNPSEAIQQAAEQTLLELEAEEDPFFFKV